MYEVHADTGVTSLQIDAQEPALQSGMRVVAHGRSDANSGKFRVSRLEILALPAEHEPTSRLGAHAKAATPGSVLVILLKFADTASDPLPVATVQSVMSSATSSVANFYREASFGADNLTMTVTSSWLRSSTMATPSTCDFTALAAAADAVASSAGYTLANFEYRVYMFPTVSACGWSGLAYVGSPKKSWINGAASIKQSVVAHEIGHNHSLLHAASLRCIGVAIGGTCAASEYGDPFNAMGNVSGMHFNAMQKALLGWIPSATVANHGGGNATYTINPIEASGGALYAVRIPAATSRVYWLEYRQPIGFDSGMSAYPNNGAQIRLASPFETLCSGCDAYSNDTQLLDLTPTTTHSPMQRWSSAAASSIRPTA